MARHRLLAWLFACTTGAAAAIAIGGASPSAAQAPLTCSPANLGQNVCQAEGICRCSYNAGGLMLRDPPGYRWDCSLLYGKCTADSFYPPLVGTTMPGPVPYGIAAVSVGRASRNQIRAAQAALQRLGYDPGPIDGAMGQRTASAISAFQRASQLPQTGSLTPETLSRLRVTG